MADYIKKNILSQAYLHIAPNKLRSPEAIAIFKKELREFTESRVAFFLVPNLPIQIDFEEGSLIARITVIGTITILLQGIANYKDFREGIQLIYADTKESPNKPSVMRESPQHLIRAAHEPDELFRL